MSFLEDVPINDNLTIFIYLNFLMFDSIFNIHSFIIIKNINSKLQSTEKLNSKNNNYFNL